MSRHVVTSTVAAFDVSPHGLYSDMSSIENYLGACQYFQVIPFLISLPIKEAQCHNVLLSFGSTRHVKKDSTFLALNDKRGFLKFIAKEYSFNCI